MHENFKEWVINDVLPPKAELIATNEDGTDFLYDESGNVLGGVRSPALDVPVARYVGVGRDTEGYAYGWSFGEQYNFTSRQLQELYGVVGTQQNYVAQVKASVDELLAQRWLAPEEAEKIVLQAELTAIP